MAAEQVTSPSSFPSHLVQLQWVATTLKKLEASTKTDKVPLPIQHPVVGSLLECLQSATPCHVTSACAALLAACGAGWLAHQELLSALVTQAGMAITYPPILKAVVDLLLREMAAIVESCSVYISPYSLRTNVHPFISILNSRPEAGVVLVHHVTHILRTHHLSEPSVQLVEPFIKHLLLHPSPPPDFTSLAALLHSDLTALTSASPQDASHLLDLQVRLLPLRTTSKHSELLWVESVVTHLTHLHSSSLTTVSRESLTEFSFHLCVELSGQDLPLLSLLQSLSALLKSGGACPMPHHVLALSWLLLHHLSSPHITASLLALGSDLCPSLPAHLSSLLTLPLIQILSQPSSALHLLQLGHAHDHTLSDNQHAASSLLKQIQHAVDSSEGRGLVVDAMATCARHGSLGGMLSSVHHYLHLRQDPSLLGAWLDGMAGVQQGEEDTGRTQHLALLLSATAVCSRDQPGILEKVFLAFGGLARAQPSLTPAILPFLLHLYKSIPDPNSKLQLFSSIPLHATHPVSAVSAVSVLRLLGATPSLLALATRLIGKAWQQQSQLYPHVKDFLTRPLPSSSLSAKELREIDLARVAVIRDICSNAAEQHGEEMLSLVSRALSSGYHDTVQVAMAMDAVISLCLHEVVDVVTVWGVLGRGGKLASDTRPGVLVALSGLFALASDLDPETSHSHKVFKSTALQFLWMHTFSQNAPVSSAALRAISAFKIQDFSSEHLPGQVRGMLESHDMDLAFPLVGSHCVLLSGCIVPAALSAYSAFLGSLVEVELSDMSRGAVHSALKQAQSVSPHETALRDRAQSLRAQQYPQAQLSNDLLKFCVLTGLRVTPEATLPGVLMSAKKRELNAALDKKVSTLKMLFAGSAGHVLEIGGGALWEGLVALYSCKRWEAVGDLCQLFYQVRLLAVNCDLRSPSSRQHQQAWEWALDQTLKLLLECVRDNTAAAPCVFMALVGVALFAPVRESTGQSGTALVDRRGPDAQKSLLSDLLTGSLALLSGDHVIGHVTCTHDVVGAVMGAGGVPLGQAVILSLPSLFRAVMECLGPFLPSNIRDKLLLLVSALYEHFSSSPNWYTAIVLNQLFLSQLPPSAQQSAIFNKLLPFLEASVQGTSVELLSLTGAFVPSLLARGHQQLARNMLTGLEQLLAHMDTQLLPSPSAQVCVLHLSHTIHNLFAAGLLSEEASMTSVTQLAAMVTLAPTEAVLQWSLGLVLHELSGCGHQAARTLAESVGTKWLQEVVATDSSVQQVTAVMLGLTGLVGVGPVRGVVCRGVASTGEHSEMMLALTCLVTDTADKLKACGDESVHRLALWVATQISSDVTESLAARERVPKDYGYLPSSSTLPSIIQTCQVLVSKGVGESTAPLLTCLLDSLSRHTGLLPPVDYSSLLLPVLRASGCGLALQQACVRCLARSKGGQGFKHLLLHCTSPHVFTSLQSDCQHFLLENLHLYMTTLHSHNRLAPFLCEVAATIYSHLCPAALTSLLRGLAGGLSSEGLSAPVSSVLRTVISVLHDLLCEAVAERLAEDTCPPHTLVSLLLVTPIWRELARCRGLAEAPSTEESGGPGGVDVAEQLCPHVEVAVQCGLVRSGSQSFKSLLPALQWVLEALPAALQDVRSLGVFFAPFYSILRVLHFGCSAQNKDSTLHQTESLHMLSTYVKRKQVPLLEKQWRAVLLLTLTGCGVAPPDLLCYPEASLAHSNSQTESATAGLMQHLLTQHQMCGLPESSRVREKLIECLLEWFGATESQLIRDSILGYFAVLKTCDQYKKNIIWSTVAYLI